jgi:hypothetical protein
MGRARRLFRTRHTAGWRLPLRFDIGTEVQCNYHGQWARGRVMAHHYEEGGEYHPYQIRLDNEQLIYAPADDDACIQKVFRFRVGTEVLCNIGMLSAPRWAPGRVVALNYEEPPGKYHPYQVKLECGTLIFAPQDIDTIVRAAENPTNGKQSTAGKENETSNQPAAKENKTSNQPAAEKREAQAPSVTLPLAGSSGLDDDCSCEAHDQMPRDHHPLIKDILASWRDVATRGTKDQVVDLCDLAAEDDADTDVSCTSDVREELQTPGADQHSARIFAGQGKGHLGQQDPCASHPRSRAVAARARRSAALSRSRGDCSV